MDRAHATRLPVLQPMLASAGRLPARPQEWAFEIKYDGARILAYLEQGDLHLWTRSGNEATDRYPELGELSDLLGDRTVILDGEVIATDAQGKPSFNRLQERMMLTRPAAVRAAMARTPVTLMIFDILWLDDRSTTKLTYRNRRELLQSLPLNGTSAIVPPAWPGTAAEEALTWTRDQGLEGVIAKRLDSIYVPAARSRNWIKLKHTRTLEVTVCGWVPSGNTLKALLLGVPDGDGLRYVGAVGTGFSDTERRSLAARLQLLAEPASPLTSGPAPERGQPVRWVRPAVHGEVEYLEYTKPGGVLRHPVWKGLRGTPQQ